MTYEELKAEATRQGYNLVKKVNRKMLPCICGHKLRSRRYSYRDGKSGVEIICMHCGKTVRGTSEVVAIKNWNKVMEELGVRYDG